MFVTLGFEKLRAQRDQWPVTLDRQSTGDCERYGLWTTSSHILIWMPLSRTKSVLRPRMSWRSAADRYEPSCEDLDIFNRLAKRMQTVAGDRENIIKHLSKECHILLNKS